MGFTDDTLAEFSNVGTGFDIAAPGTCVRSLGRQPGTIATMYGTSMGAPHVIGALARFKARQPRASADAARDRLLSDTGSKPSGSPFGLSGPDGRLPGRVLYLGR